MFSRDSINSYIAFKEEDVRRIRMAPHPLEFEMYLLAVISHSTHSPGIAQGFFLCDGIIMVKCKKK